MRKIITTIVITLAIALAFFCGHNHGYNHAIKIAMPTIENDCIVIDFNGELHEYFND